MGVRAQTMVLHQAKHPQMCQLASSVLPWEYILVLAGSQQLGPSVQGASWLLLSPYHQDNAHARSEGLLGVVPPLPPEGPSCLCVPDVSCTVAQVSLVR